MPVVPPLLPLRVTRCRSASRLNCPASLGLQSRSLPPTCFLSTLTRHMRWDDHFQTIFYFSVKNIYNWVTEETEWHIHQYPLSESIKWTFLLWLEQVCSDSSQIEQKHDPLSNFFTKHTCGVEDKIKNIQLKKWSVARLIGLSWGDALWILFSISQARQLSGLLRKIICILLAVLILLLAIYKHLIPPTTGFFNCNDPTMN